MSNSTRNEPPESLRLRIEADHYSLGMNVGFYTREEVIAWADSMLGTDAPPIPEIIELSLMNHPDVEGIVRQIRGGYRDPADQRLPIARLFEEMAAGVRSGEREPERVARQVYGVALSQGELFLDVESEAFAIDDWFGPYSPASREEATTRLLVLLDSCVVSLRSNLYGDRAPADLRLPIARLFEAMAAGVRSGEREPQRVAQQLYSVALSREELFLEVVPEALAIDDWFAPHSIASPEETRTRLLDLLDSCIASLRHNP